MTADKKISEFCKDLESYVGPKRGKKLSAERRFWDSHPELIATVIAADVPVKSIYAFAQQNELPLPGQSTFGSWLKEWRKQVEESEAQLGTTPSTNGHVSSEKVLVEV